MRYLSSTGVVRGLLVVVALGASLAAATGFAGQVFTGPTAGEPAGDSDLERPFPPAFVPPKQPGSEQWSMPHLWERRPSFPYLPGEDRGASRSIGGVVHGHLVHSVQIPQPHPALTFLDVQYERRLFYTTDRMRDLVVEAANYVREKYPHAVLRLGNFGNPGGGDIPYSVSHNSGRDADLGFYVKGPDGEMAAPADLVPLDAHGRYEGEEGTFIFEPKRNWRLIEGLIVHGGDQLQYIFVSNSLRRQLLRRAREVGAAAKIRRRAKALLHQPYGSLPHNDHFHIRLYCSRIDVQSGCWDRGTKHSWYDSHADAERRTVREARKALRAGRSSIRAAAARRLGLLEDEGSAGELREVLDDPSPTVRAAAARALASVDAGADALVARLEEEEAGQVYLELVDALARVGGPDAARALTRELDEARRLELPGRYRTDARTFVAEALIRLESAHPVDALVELLDAERADVRAASARALRYLTNHDFGGRWRADESKWSAALAEWRGWLSEHGDEPRDAWLREGFERHGFEVERLDGHHVWSLCRAIKNEDFLSHNAQRILMRISGRQPESLSWPKEDASFYWRRWFERRRHRFGAPPIPEELSTLE